MVGLHNATISSNETSMGTRIKELPMKENIYSKHQSSITNIRPREHLKKLMVLYNLLTLKTDERGDNDDGAKEDGNDNDKNDNDDGDRCNDSEGD